MHVRLEQPSARKVEGGIESLAFARMRIYGTRLESQAATDPEPKP